MSQLVCVGPNNIETTFAVTRDDSIPNEIRYYVRTIPPPDSQEFFEFGVEIIPEGLKVIMIDAHDRVYRAKGIPDSLLPYVANETGRPIFSSRKREVKGWRTESATKMWNRLVNKNLASYSESEDVYRLPSLVIP